MRFDLLTLYALAIGTLLLSLGMTLWERRAHPCRSPELGCWAAAYGLLAAGCSLAIARTALPGWIGWAASNLVITSGYMLILIGVGRLEQRRHARLCLGLLLATGIAWILFGPAHRDAMWSHGSAVPIAIVCGATAWEIARADTLRPYRVVPVIVLVSGVHALFYLVRATLLPLLALRFGDGIMPAFAQLTMYEGVLYSVSMPMALLALIREEAQLEMTRVAHTDHLTGLANRHDFFARGAALLAGTAGPVALLAFDLDHFKAINDLHGHAAGDRVLRSFARIARATLPGEAVLARLGGEEFAALLPGVDREHARALGEMLAQRFGASREHDEAGLVRATVSIGVAARLHEQDRLDEMLAAADQALYRAKAAGRNRVELARPLLRPASLGRLHA
ncbi:GGDEF domain-containing protein [Sphingomonas morindae]|uniref:diguanylate cyclase n=1 Tax=Sphingomonas morindae TaxID=1541170 RepID=A0ABY4X6P2_9SPHN|nr:GGDEF domain-containing protein [Sphingomonas morindae]USI72592.1 GGDEF domain-containing protein [Sphingomonas morindae]